MDNWNDRGRLVTQREARDRFDGSDDPMKQEEIRHALRQGKTGLLESVARPIMIIVLIAIGSLGYFTFGPAISSQTNKHVQLGIQLAEQGRPQEAIVEFDEAIRRNPQHADAYKNRALAYTVLGNEVKAEKDVELALELGIDPGEMEVAIQDVRNRQSGKR